MSTVSIHKVLKNNRVRHRGGAPQTAVVSGVQRLRRLRQREAFRRLVRQRRLSVDQLVMPLFVRSGRHVRVPIPSLPGQFQLSVDELVKECRELSARNIPAVLLFGCADRKDEQARCAFAKDGIVQQALNAVKSQMPELLMISDVCLCAYTSHGHCGIVKRWGEGRGTRGEGKGLFDHASGRDNLQSLTETDFWIDNDATLEVLAKVALSHVQAGADMVAPSDMMDGTVGIIRSTLDASGYGHVPIMAYSAKFASSFYGPFRDAVASSPQFGDRRSYQLDVANTDEALRKVALDLEQGADIVMVKPALSALHIIWRVKHQWHRPVAAFSVSGEYAMIKAAAARGWLVERAAALEILLAMTRAGADVLITYWAKEAARWLQER